MNPRKCVQAVRAATGDAFTETEIDDYLDRLAQKAKRAKREAPTIEDQAAIRQAAAELTREEIFASLAKKRMEIAAEVARTNRRARLKAMPGDEAQRLRAYDVGSEKQGRFTSSSVDAEGRARAMSLWGQVEIGLRKVPGLLDRISNFWGFSEREVDRKIAREMARLNGDTRIQPTDDEGVIHAARVFVDALESGRLQQNDQGAFISKLPGYIARQAHDRLKVSGGFWRELAEVGRRIPKKGLKGLDWAEARQAAARRAFGEWRDFIRPRLDERTFAGLDMQDVTWRDVLKADTEEEADQLAMRARLRQRDLADAKGLHDAGVLSDPNDLAERMLYRVWFDIVTGRHETLTGMNDLGDFRPPAGKATSVSKSRVLHFKDPDAWMDYAAKYGRGSLFQTVMGQLERAGRNTALMQRWGPNPDAARAAELARLASEAQARGDPDVAKRLYSARQAADFDALNGRLGTPENLRLAIILRNIRAWEGITKLGGIVLSKATDLPMTGHTFARAGAGFLAGYDAAFRGILDNATWGKLGVQSEEARHAAELLDVGARSFAGHMGGQFSANDGSLGWAAWASRLMYRLNLFDFVNEGVRKGAATMIARHLGKESENAWSELHPGTRETFERFGIDEGAWDLARQGIETADDGRKYFTLDNLSQLQPRELLQWAGIEGKKANLEAAERARSDLELRFRTMLHNVIDDTTSEPRLREQAAMSFGTRAGTPMGEAARAFWQFKGFVQTILGRHLVPAATGYGGYAPAALMAHFIVSSALAGYISMNAKMIASGQMPRSIVGKDAAETAKIWTAALAQGGGLGIYGDFLFGEANRNGQDWGFTAMAGPAIGDMEQVGKILFQLVHGGAINEKTGRSLIPGELVHVAARNVPLINLFYTRVILDYLVFWRLSEAASPGYLQRYQARVENDEGRSFIVPPTAAR